MQFIFKANVEKYMEVGVGCLVSSLLAIAGLFTSEDTQLPIASLFATISLPSFLSGRKRSRGSAEHTELEKLSVPTKTG